MKRKIMLLLTSLLLLGGAISIVSTIVSCSQVEEKPKPKPKPRIKYHLTIMHGDIYNQDLSIIRIYGYKIDKVKWNGDLENIYYEGVGFLFEDLVHYLNEWYVRENLKPEEIKVIVL